VIVSLTNIVPDFRSVFRYDDLFNKPAKCNLEKMVRFQAPLFYLRNQIVKSKFSESAVKAHMVKLLDEKRQLALGTLNGTKTKQQ